MPFHKLRLENPERIISYININYIRNKFDCLTAFTKNEIDILVISQNKLISSFPQMQFCMSGFSKPYIVDRNNKAGNILLYIREGITSKSIPVLFNSNNLEYLLVEISLRKKKWLLFCSYNLRKSFGKF